MKREACPSSRKFAFIRGSSRRFLLQHPLAIAVAHLLACSLPHLFRYPPLMGRETENKIGRIESG